MPSPLPFTVSQSSARALLADSCAPAGSSRRGRCRNRRVVGAGAAPAGVRAGGGEPRALPGPAPARRARPAAPAGAVRLVVARAERVARVAGPRCHSHHAGRRRRPASVADPFTERGSGPSFGAGRHRARAGAPVRFRPTRAEDPHHGHDAGRGRHGFGPRGADAAGRRRLRPHQLRARWSRGVAGHHPARAGRRQQGWPPMRHPDGPGRTQGAIGVGDARRQGPPGARRPFRTRVGADSHPRGEGAGHGVARRDHRRADARRDGVDRRRPNRSAGRGRGTRPRRGGSGSRARPRRAASRREGHQSAQHGSGHRSAYSQRPGGPRLRGRPRRLCRLFVRATSERRRPLYSGNWRAGAPVVHCCPLY